MYATAHGGFLLHRPKKFTGTSSIPHTTRGADPRSIPLNNAESLSGWPAFSTGPCPSLNLSLSLFPPLPAQIYPISWICTQAYMYAYFSLHEVLPWSFYPSLRLREFGEPWMGHEGFWVVRCRAFRKGDYVSHFLISWYPA